MVNGPKAIHNYLKNEKSSHSWNFMGILVTWNLSFNMSTYFGEYMLIFLMIRRWLDKLLSIINRHKTKNIIEQVLVTAIDLTRLKGMRKMTSLVLDFFVML